MLTIRAYTPEDVEPVYEAVTESRAELAPWMPWCHPAYSINDTRAWVQQQVDAFREGKEYSFVICDEVGQILGTCGLNHIDRQDRRANLGYWVRSSCTGHGIATEATRLLVQWAFAHTDLIRLEVVASVKNTASQRVVEKAGGYREGILRKRGLLPDGPHDCVVYSFVRE